MATVLSQNTTSLQMLKHQETNKQIEITSKSTRVYNMCVYAHHAHQTV